MTDYIKGLLTGFGAYLLLDGFDLLIEYIYTKIIKQ